MPCKNCNTTLKDTDDFCYNCGAKVIRNRLTVKNLFAHFCEQFLNYDNKLLQTFIHLFTKPEQVIGSYIDGTRKKYVNVISYFAIGLTLSGLQLFILDKFFPEAMDLSLVTVGGTEEFNEKNMSFIREYQSLLTMLNVPIFALVSYFVFYTLKKFNYTEHLVIFMYVLTQLTIISFFITTVIVFLGWSIAHATLVLGPIQVIYSMYCLKRLYRLSAKGLFLRTLLFFLIAIIGAILISILSAVMMYFNGDFEKIIEAQKAAQEAKGG